MLDSNYTILNKDLVFRVEDDGAFLFDPNNGKICYLNELGMQFWKAFETDRSPKQFVEDISSDYPDIPVDKIIDDCVKFLDDLKRMEFIG